MSGAIQHTMIPYGGRPHRAMKIICGYCGAQYGIHTNTFQGPGTGRDDREQRWASRKFEGEGWKIGKTESGNRCPQCYMAIKMAAVRKSKQATTPTTTTTKEASVKVVPKAEPVPVQPALRELRREDRTRIIMKLAEVYDKGYSADWSDARVATTLDVPRAWVTELRKENFGDDEGNEELRKLLGGAQALLAEARKVGATAEPLLRELHELTEKVDRLDRLVVGALAKLGPVVS